MSEHSVRKAEFADREAVARLLAKLGLVMPERDVEIVRHWSILWEKNPAVPVHTPSSPGWVLEFEGKIVGFFGCVPLVFYYGEKLVRVALCSQWGVEREHRTDTWRLSEAFFAQEDCDLFMVTTAIVPTGRIFLRFGARKIPQKDLDKVLYWPIDGAAFSLAACRRINIPAWLARPLAGLSGVALGPLTAIAKYRARKASRPWGFSVLPGEDVAGEFDALWSEVIRSGNKLISCRNSATLRWYFTARARVATVRVVVCRDGARLLGYAAVSREDSPEVGLTRLKIVDLFTVDETRTPEIVRALVAQSYEMASEEKCHVLEAPAFPPAHQKALNGSFALTRRLGAYPYFYKAREPSLAGILEKAENWQITYYEGDSLLMLR